MFWGIFYKMKIPHTGFLGSSNDHQFRSGFIQWLFHQPTYSVNKIPEKRIPRVIVQYWHDLKNIPDDVRMCLKSWSPLKKNGYRIELFCNESARDFIDEEFSKEHLKAFDTCYHPAMKCDYFRLCYIYINGGFYVDADEVYKGTECEYLFHDNKFKIQPLCYYI